MDIWAVVEHERPLQKITQPIPEPKGTEVVIKVTHCGVCHSDLHFWDGWWDLGDGERFRISDRGATLPRAVGHEILGDIVKAGPEAGDVPVGARRVVYPWVGCGHCERCDDEEDNMCTAQRSLGVMTHGGFAEYVVVPHSRYLVDPGDLDPLVACTFGCSGITTLSAISKIMPMPPDRAVVLIGAGGLGVSGIAMLQALGHKNIVVMDISKEKLEIAKKLGAKVVDGSNPIEDIKTAAGGLVMAVIDFVNSSKTAPIAQAVLAKGAKWVQVGVMGGKADLNLCGMIFKGITIYGNLTGNPKHLREVVRLAKDGKLPVIPTETIPWDEANNALERLRAGKVKGRLIMVKE